MTTSAAPKRPTEYRATLPDGSRETIYLPTDSSYLYDQSHSIGSQFEATVFYTVLKQTGKKDKEGRAIYDLADVVAYDDEFVTCFAPTSEENINARKLMPLAADLWDQILSKPDHGYIPISEIKEGKHASLMVLNASWMIFTQEPVSQDTPTLWAQIIKGGNEFFVAGPLIAGEEDLSRVHCEYYLTNISSPAATHCDLYGFYIDDAEFPDAQEHIEQSHADIAEALELKPTRDKGAVPLWIIPPETLGLKGNGFALRDKSGDTHTLHGYPSVEGGTATLTMFGLVKAEQPSMRVIFMNKHVDAVGVTKLGAERVPQLFSPLLREITKAILDNGTWPQPERHVSSAQRLANGLRWLMGYKV